MKPVSSEIARQVLLGLHGPYADPRVAVDALDNVATWVTELDDDGVVELAGVLVGLATDPDDDVATGAVLALDIVRRGLAATERLADAVARMVDLALDSSTALDRVPTGFHGAAHATLRAELAVVAARSASTQAVTAMTSLVERASSIGVARVELTAALAERLPALVVANARTWAGPGDSAVLARLRDHHRRIAVAGAVRPWDEQAIRSIKAAGQWQQWHAAELDAVRRVMRDEAPELTAPSGVGEVDLSGWWWIVAERPWDWTLWRSGDGRAVLERVEGTVGIWNSVHDVSPEVAESIIAATVAGADVTGPSIVTSPRPDPAPPGAPERN